MEALKDYFVQNWSLILIIMAFAIMLRVTVFLERKQIVRMYVLIGVVLVLSVIVFIEFYLADLGKYTTARSIMTAIRYSTTPVIIALILFTLVKRTRWYVIIPAVVLAIVNFISIPTGIVFSIDGSTIVRGPLGYLPYIGVGLYSVVLVYVLVKQCNKQASEIIPIAFLAFAFASGLVLPFIFKRDYAKIFCSTIAVALFVYYVFMVLQLTKKDALTGLLNRQAYYASIRHNSKDITAFISIDMNGLKTINDNGGHHAGDEALASLASCLFKAAKAKQSVHRIGGDEFVIICRRTTKEELEALIVRIKQNVSGTPYTCSIGYCYRENDNRDLEEMVKESDKMMYADKADYYARTGKDRRIN